MITADISLTQFENVKSASNAGYELIAKVSPSSVFDLTGNLNVYYHNILTATRRLAFNQHLVMPGMVILPVTLNRLKRFRSSSAAITRARRLVPQGNMYAIYGVDGGVQYDITKTLNLSVNARDIFNTRKFTSVVVSDGGALTQYSERRFATRIVLFTLAYRFGANTPAGRQRQQKKQDQQPDQQDSNPDDVPQGGGNGGGAGQGKGGQPGGQIKM